VGLATDGIILFKRNADKGKSLEFRDEDLLPIQMAEPDRIPTQMILLD
jgi:hypothetical protein